MEQECSSGSVRLLVSPGEDGSPNSLATVDNIPLAELRGCAYIDYTWCEPYMWEAIACRGDGTIVRSVRCDGVWMASSDGTVWDAKHWFGTAPSGLDVDRDVAIWPYIVASHYHLFPFTWGREPYSQELSEGIWVEPRESGASPDGTCRMTLELSAVYGVPWQTVTVDTCKGKVPISRDYGHPPELSVRYDAPELVAGDLWIPRECQVLVQNGEELQLIWSTELVIHESRFNKPVDPKTFNIEVLPGTQTMGGGSGWQKRQLKRQHRESLREIPGEIWQGFLQFVLPLFAVAGCVVAFVYMKKRYHRAQR